MYTVVGYEKDGDVYTVLESGITNKEQAITVAEEKALLLRAGKLRREDNGEPMDWIEVYYDFGGKHELRVWIS